MDTASALAWFDTLPAVTIDDLLGAWRGRGVPTGHPLDGLLERFGWHGKRFASADDAHPLVFAKPDGTRFEVDPAFVPMALVARHPRWFARGLVARAFRAGSALVRTTAPRARLRMTEYRGVVSATMIYDALPVNDVFRRVDDDTRLGLMDLRGMAQPFFFTLHREAATISRG